MDAKVCITCKKKKKLDCFWKDKTHKDGRRSSCSTCLKKYDRSYKNRPHVIVRNKIYNKKVYPKKAIEARYKKYGITHNEYVEMLNKQLNKCAICLLEISGRNIHTDHNHITGKVRGLLCQKCNMGLGCYKDNIHLLQKAIEYLSATV